MRNVMIAMMVLAALMSGCKKNTAQTQQTAKTIAPASAPVVTRPNTIIAPLSPEQAKSPKRVLVSTTFTCSDKSKFAARFLPNEMEIDIGWGKTVTLSQQIVASGFWYKNEQYEIRGKGQQATLSIQGRKPLGCTSSR